MQHIFVEPLGQDDNLGDSVLRAAYMDSLRGEGRRLHVQVGGQSSDYVAGLPLHKDDVVYSSRTPWLAASRRASKPVWVINAGEWTMKASGSFPTATRVAEMQHIIKRGGLVIAAGLGVQSPAIAATVDFAPTFLEAALVSWRDAPSQAAAGFGNFAPDWAYALGTRTAEWLSPDERPLLSVSLRFDRPWPGDAWLEAVKALSRRTGTKIVTLAQVSRDSPRAVHLADVLGGEYLVAASTSHPDLDDHVRSVYARSLAVVSDRAHGLIIGATEGAYPVGSAADPQKISRMLEVAGVGACTGDYQELADRSERLEQELPGMAASIDGARSELAVLRSRIGSVLSAAS